MTGELAVSLSTEALDFGPAEERATSGLFAVTANGHPLTFGEDIAQKELRHGPHVSGYPVAEWLAWNWGGFGGRSAVPPTRMRFYAGTLRTVCQPSAQGRYGQT